MINTNVINVCHLSSVHTSSDIRIFHKECISLLKMGYIVSLIAINNKDEIVDGVQIRALSQIENRFKRMTKGIWRVYQMAVKEDALVYHFHDPELIPIGLLLKLRGKKVIYDVHEDTPKQIMKKKWIPTRLLLTVSIGTALLEWLSALFFDGIVAATPAIARNFPISKTITVQNFPMIHELEMVSEQPIPYEKRPLLVSYIGMISEIRGINEMIRSIGMIPSNIQVRLKMAGSYYPSGLEQDIKQLPGRERVDFLGWLSRKQVYDLLGQTRIGLVLFHPVPNHIEAQPSKLFEYMSAGIPVITSDFPLWREIVEGTGCGLLVDPLDPRAIAETIQWLLEHSDEAVKMGKNGQKAVQEKYNWDIEAKKLVDFYYKIMR